MGAHEDEARSSRFKCSRQYETVEEAMLPRVHHPYLLWEGCNQAAWSRYNTRLAQLLLILIYLPCVVDWNVLNQIGYSEAIDEMLTIKLCVAGKSEEIFTSEAWTNAFNIDEQIYSELCHEFYSTYEFDERLGLYKSEEIEEEGFDVYFQGGLRSDEHFNAQEYWLSISREENLSLSRSHASTILNPVLRVLHKMITYDLSLDTTTLRELIVSEDRLIPEALEPVLSLGQVCWGYLSTWLGFTVFHCREPITHLDIISSSMTSIQQYPPQQQQLDDDEELIVSEDRLIPEALEPVLSLGQVCWGYLSTWLGFTVFHCREPITHLDIISSSMTSIQQYPPQQQQLDDDE
uniref:Uncharacterized protein n=1 Tax=Tanacetum cinerariifolium TaxID=118510 RepID=A0A6L2KZE7_TANCI|nr:hypothetical protein [Tanacetum cinerariifolium]